MYLKSTTPATQLHSTLQEPTPIPSLLLEALTDKYLRQTALELLLGTLPAEET